jgi:pimeloyl-ACP methyl ester carboxylesterase
VKVSIDWFSHSGAGFSAGIGRRGCAQLTHYTANYCEWGEGPPLVLIPGLAGGYELLGPIARCLARDYRVISYQLRGEEDCFALRRPFGLPDLADDLAELLDYLYLESPAIFGVSFGGIIGLEFAARHPHRLESLILQGVGARFERTLIQHVAGLVLSRFPLPPDSPFINQFFHLLFGGREKREPLFQFVTRQCWRTDQSVMAHRFRLVESFNVEGRLHRIQAPTLILSGDKDLLVTPGSLSALYRGIPNCQLVRMPQAGHLGFVTQPAHVAEQVRLFLDGQPAC